MDWIQKYQLFLFDFDGLLVDTERLHYSAYMELARLRGCPLDWDFERFCLEAHSKSMGFFEGLQREYPNVFNEGPSQKELYEEKKRLYISLLRSTRLELMEGVLPLINALHRLNVRCAVVTNSPKAQIDLIKAALPDLHKIPLWITREDYTAPKPSPEGYLQAIALLGRPGDRIVGFEDSIKGLKALLAAGVEAFLVGPVVGPERVSEALALGAKHVLTLAHLS